MRLTETELTRRLRFPKAIYVAKAAASGASFSGEIGFLSNRYRPANAQRATIVVTVCINVRQYVKRKLNM